ncbi:hypothetical protein IGI04_017897 [Brassica rapa subsp. trilocularis]|uniref:2-oxoglutarate (2OG) and Fe(II)-dependent oxygenase superfamily protein n=2 Tax=Brassica TaxID=3705 RepID=A0ABQ8D6Y8_BRANA|nr:uncharacterized protein LOC106454647 [Brassica napus]KAG5396083.1 hypothetical protein IGI04_017897 [Brassica rapa subsp. trilocularis]KAH0925130.1 hypothetical protein HID58_017386 [Brassica napus]
MALMRTRSQLNVSSPPPLPSPIPRARGSRSAANEILTEIIEKSIQVPELTLPESHSGGESCGARHLIPAEIDFRLLTSRREGSVDRLVRSAREFGAFRVSYHGISSEEMRSLVRESGRVFGVLEGRDTGFRRSVVGNRDEIVWVRSWKERMEWAREYIGPERYRCFSQEMENVADKLEGVARKLGQIMVENSRRQTDKRIQIGESVLSVYRYNHENVTEQSPPLPKETTEEMLHYTLSLHLPAKNCEFRVDSGKGGGPLSFHADPDTILVTFGRQLEEWSLGEFKCRQGEIIYHPDVYGSRTSFSVELKCMSLFLSHASTATTCKTFSLTHQIFTSLLLLFFFQFFWSYVSHTAT